jgi:pantothenate kinase type III
MQSGIVNGYIGLLSGLLAAVRGELVERSPADARVTVVATGGFSLQPWLADVPGIDRVEPELTLRGIRHAYELLSAGTGARAGVAGADRS